MGGAETSESSSDVSESGRGVRRYPPTERLGPVASVGLTSGAGVGVGDGSNGSMAFQKSEGPELGVSENAPLIKPDRGNPLMPRKAMDGSGQADATIKPIDVGQGFLTSRWHKNHR
jgi:hypothetical protein